MTNVIETPATKTRQATPVEVQTRLIVDGLKTQVLSALDNGNSADAPTRCARVFEHTRSAVERCVMRAYQAGTRLGFVLINHDDSETAPPRGVEVILLYRDQDNVEQIDFATFYEDGGIDLRHGDANKIAAMTNWRMPPTQGEM